MSKVVYEGWMVRYGRRKIGRSFIHMRYFVLESRLLAYYKKKPKDNVVMPQFWMLFTFCLHPFDACWNSKVGLYLKQFVGLDWVWILFEIFAFRKMTYSSEKLSVSHNTLSSTPHIKSFEVMYGFEFYLKYMLLAEKHILWKDILFTIVLCLS